MDTVGSSIDYWRQSGILPPKALENINVVLIGAGGIGSPTALTLVKMGIPHLTIYDDDKVEKHNLPNQLFKLKDQGLLKVTALKQTLGEYAPAKVEVVAKRFGKGSSPLKGIVISGVDTMAARNEIWNAVRDNPDVPLYIEARMGAEVLRLYTLAKPFSPDLIAWYEDTLYSDEQAQEAPCTMRAIFYTVMVTAGCIGSQVKKYIQKESFQKEVIIDLKTMFLSVS